MNVMRDYPWILCLTLLITTPCKNTPVRSSQQIQVQSEKQNLGWQNFVWEKKAPQDRRPPTPDQNENNKISPSRRASAPHYKETSKESRRERKVTVDTRSVDQLQARRHNSAPMLRLQLEPVILMATQSAMPKTPDVTISPPTQILSMEPLDYFDPRFSATSTPDELKEQGITKSAAEKMVLRRQSKEEESVFANNLRDGLLTCSLCLMTFPAIENLQSHLSDHTIIQ